MKILPSALIFTFKSFSPNINMVGKIAKEVAMVQGAMLNLGYDGFSKMEPPSPLSNGGLYVTLIETHEYCRIESDKIRKRLGIR